MKILQIANKAPYPPNDGSSIAIYNMAEGLMENGAELHLLTINTKKHFKPDDQVPADFRKKAHYRAVYHNTNTGIIGAIANLFSTHSYFVSRFYFEEFKHVLSDILKKNEFDIVQLEGLFIATYIPLIRKLSKAKIVLRAHNIEYLIWERHIANEKNVFKSWYLNIQKKRLKKFELQVYAHVDAIVTITEVDEQTIKILSPGIKTFTCITGVDLSHYKTTERVTNPKSIFYFGSMDWMPNIEAVDWFIDNCWKELHTKYPDIKFIVAGRNMPERFKNMSRPGIQFIENIKDKDKFYSDFDIMLVPLLSGSGLRIKIVEGMSYGKAIVSTSIGAEGIAAKNNTHILIADTPREFTAAIEKVILNNDYKITIQQNARKFAEEHFDNKIITEKLIDFYNQLFK